MAKGNTGGAGRGLNLKAKLDIAEAKRSALELTNLLKGMKIASAEASPVSKTKAFDTKPLTEYQAAQLKIKQGFLDLAKQKADDLAASREKAAAEKSASLVLQASLKEEARLKREQIALQQKINSEATKNKPAKNRDFSAETSSQNSLANSTARATSIMSQQVIARAQLNTEAAKQAAANGTLVTTVNAYTVATQQQTTATNQNVLSKKQLAQMLAEEKLRQADATKELKNNAREMLNAKGSLEQRRAALIRLTTVYDRLSVVERNSSSGNRMTSIIKGLTDQVKQLEAATGRAQRNVGNYPNVFGKMGADANSAAGKIVVLNEKLKFFQDALTRAKAPESFVNLNRKIEETRLALERLNNAGKKGFDNLGNRDPFQAAKIREAANEIKNYVRETSNAKGSIEQRKAALERLTSAYKKMSEAERSSAAGMRMGTIIKGVSEQIKTLEGNLKSGGKGVSDFFGSLKDKILHVLGPLALLLAAWNAIKEAFTHNVEISDNFVDVQRTVKFSADEVDRLGEQLKKVNTRTNLEGLLDIGFEGGRLGVKKDEIFDFIKTVDQLAVVLKKEIGGGAQGVAESLGKIAIVFKLAENEGITLGEAMSKVGSAQLDLAHSGPVTVKYLQDFTLGMAGTATAAKLSLPVIEAYGAVLGGSGQIASSAALSLTRLISGLSTKKEKYFAIAQLADATLTLEKFTDTINTDAKAALDLFFKGLTTGNPVATELDDRLKSVGITTGKVSNAVKILAGRQELLAEKVAIGTKGYEENTSISHNFELANNSLAASFDKIKNSISNAFTDSSFSRGLASLVNSITDNRTESEKLSMAYEDNKHASDELTKTLDPLVKRYEELKSKGKLNTDEQTELRDIIVKIAEIIPDSATALNKYGEALDINTGKVREFTKAQKESLELQNRDALKKANKEFEDADTFLKTAVKVQQGTNKAKKDWLNSIMDLGGGDSEKRIRQKAKDDVTETLDIAYKAAVAVRKLDGELSKAQKDIIARFEKPKVKPKVKEEVLGTGEGTEEDVLVMDVKAIKKEIKSLTEANIKLGNTGKQFELNVKRIRDLRKQLKEAGGGVDNSGIKAENEYQTAVKARNTLQEKISELIKKGIDKQLSADAQELESVRNKYDEMRKAAVKFNNDPGNKKKGLRVDAGGLVVAQSNEEDAVRDKQDTEKLKVKLTAQKKLYDDFESYKAKLGEKEAKKKFKDLFDTDKTYLQNLQSQLDALTNPQKSKGGSEEDAAAKQLQKKFLEEQIELAKAAEEEKNNDLLVSARQAAMTKAEELLKIEEEYQKNLLALKQKGDDTPERVAVLDKARKKSISELAVDELTDSEAWKNLFSDMDTLTITQIDTLIKEIEVKFADLSVKFDPIDMAEIRKKMQEMKRVVIEGSPFTKIGAAIKAVFTDSANGAKKSTEQIQAEWNNLSLATASSFKFIDDAIQSCYVLKDVVGEVGEAAINSLVQISQAGIAVSKAVQIAGAASAAVASSTAAAISTAEKASVILAIVSAALTVVQAISGLFKSIFNAHDKRIEKSIEKHKDQVDSLGRAYSRLERDVNNAIGKAVEQAHLNQIDNLKQQQVELEKIRDAESRKKKPDQGKINEANDQIASIGDKIQDVQKAMVEALTGTTAKSISDGIISGFKSGKRAAADFADDFNGLMEDALLKALQTNFLDVEMAKFYKQFAEAAKDGITDEEAAKLRTDYTGIINEGLNLVKDIDKITGGPKKKDEDSETGTLRASLTEETGSKLEGLWRGQYDMTRQLVIQSTERNALLIPVSKGIGELYSIAKANFDVALRIEANTLRTADNTERLREIELGIKTIASNTKPTTTPRALGI